MAAACTPKLAGTCASNADCKGDERCSPEGLCLLPGHETGSGDAGNTSGSIDILSPAGGALEPGHFHVSAQTTSAVAIQDVTFQLTNAATAADIGRLVITGGSTSWQGELTLTASSFGGLADLRAVMHRAGLADVVSAKVSVTVDQNGPSISATWNATQWRARSASFPVTASVSDDRTGVASATLLLPDGGGVSGTIASGVATFQVNAADVGPPGAAGAVPLALAASDLAGNQTQVNNASFLQIDDQPPSVSVQAFDPAVWHNGPLDFTATLDDGAGSGINSASLLLNGAFTAGEPDAGGVFRLHADLSALPPTEGAVVLQVVGKDAVGNLADGGSAIQVDNIPPVVGDARIDSAPDVTDLSGRGWFKGPAIAPAGAAIQISMVVTDANPVTSPVATALVGANSYPGTFSAGRWSFSIPRSVASGAVGAVNVTFDAQDVVGNHATASPTLPIYFDDQKTLSPAAANDPAFHGPSQTVSVSVQVAPPSGFPIATGAVDLAGAGKLSFGSCTGGSAIGADASSIISSYPALSTLVFKVPMSCAPATTDAAVSYGITVNSLAGGSGATSGSINVDTKGPVVGDVLVPYPTPPSNDPLFWSHDGNHFHRRESGALFSFAAYDCHGLSSSQPTISFPGATVSAAADTRGVLNPGSTCASPSGVTVTRYTVSNLASVPTSSLAQADNALGWTATVSDGLGNQGSTSGSINVTRKLWQAQVFGSSVALGPLLFASGGLGMSALDPATATASSWSGVFANGSLLIAPNAGTPAVIYVAGNTVTAGNAATATQTNFGGCAHGDTVDAVSLLDASTVVFSSHTSSTTFQDKLVLNGTTVSCVSTATPPATGCTGAPGGPAAWTNKVSSASPVAWVGLNGGSWNMANGAGATTGTISGLASPTLALIDGSNPPNVYLSGVGNVTGRIEPRVITSTPGFGAAPFHLPDFPAAIDDMQLGQNGILYVLANNTASAVITDSIGGATAAGGTQTGAWPSLCRDPCRSSNAGVQCPY